MKTIDEIGYTMADSGIPLVLVTLAVGVAIEFEGVEDLLRLWDEEKDTIEKEEILDDIKEMIEECKGY